MRKTMRKRVAVMVTAALCATLCPEGLGGVRTEVAAAEVRAVSETETQINQWTPGDSWEEEEVVAELDENNTDGNGYTYQLKMAEPACTAELSQFEITRYKEAKEDIMMRVPDRVRRDGIEYIVTSCSLRPSMSNIMIRKKFQIYIGKNVEKLSFGLFDYSLSSYVHKENKNFISQDGILFSQDKTELIRFGDEKYGYDMVYTIPESVNKLSSKAFYGASIKEVVLNDQIKELPDSTFYNSSLQKIDLKNVRKIGRYVFDNCRGLREVKIRHSGVEIGEKAFVFSGIKYLYLPSETLLKGSSIFESCTDLEAVIINEGVGNPNGNAFGMASNLKMVILSDGMTKISKGMFSRCCSLRKLYVPDGIQSVESLVTGGAIHLYGKKENILDEQLERSMFVNISGHTHRMKKVTFFEYDSWGVKGKYCEECAYACDIECVEYEEEGKKESMPELLKFQKDCCPSEIELDDANMDEQGVVYSLDSENGTATVVSKPNNYLYVILPENVKKDGKNYVLESIGEHALAGADTVLVSDTVKNIKEYAMRSTLNKIVLGKNVCNIARTAFSSTSAKIEIPSDNPNFRISGNAVYTADGSELIKYQGDWLQKEFKVPTRVVRIWSGAFYKASLEKISLYNCGREMKDKSELSTVDKGIEIVYEDEYTWYDDKDYLLEINDKNMDENGWEYEFDGEKGTASVCKIDCSESTSAEINLKAPDKVVKDNMTYTVENISFIPKENIVISAGKQTRLYIGKYVRNVNTEQFMYQTINYVHLENPYLFSEGGSLFRKNEPEESLPTSSESPIEEPSPTPPDIATEEPSSSPVGEPSESPSSEPSEEPGESPSPLPSEEPSPSPAPADASTAKPSPSQAASPTEEPPTSRPTGEPTEEPSELPSLTPTGESSPSPTEEPPTSRPAAEPTEMPRSSPEVSPTAMPPEKTNAQTSAPTTEPVIQIINNYISVPVSSDHSDVPANLKKSLAVTGFRISTKDNRNVTLRWKANTNATYYRIYRANRKNGTYLAIQTVKASKTSYKDKKVKPLKRYYYKVTALRAYEGGMTEGRATAVRSICVSGITAPKIAVKKGRLDSIRYVTVTFKKYQGKYANIRISFDGKKYKNLKLVSNKIAKYKGRFKIQYMVKKKTIYFKVRTYRKKGTKKYYSGFSNVVKIRV